MDTSKAQYRLVENELVLKAQQGDVHSLNQILVLYRDTIFAIAMTIFKNRHDADDATQEIMIRIGKKLKSYRGDSSLGGWIYPVAQNLCIDLVKKRNNFERRHVSTEDEPNLESKSVTQPAFKHDYDLSPVKKARRQIHKALESMSEKHRMILIMYSLEGLSYEQMAMSLNVPKGTIMSRLSNARYYFKQNLEIVGTDQEMFYKLRDL